VYRNSYYVNQGKLGFKEIEADVFNEKEFFLGTKTLYSYDGSDYYSKFVNSIKLKTGFT